MTFNLSIFYKNSGLTPTKLYYSNTRHHFRMNAASLPLRAILHLRKIPNVIQSDHIIL